MLAGAASLIALADSSSGVAAPIDGLQDPAAESFDAMKRLVGTWRPAGSAASPLRIRFWLTAGGTVLVEAWSRGERPHSLTLYHRDGARLIATHYCPQGNQPRLRQVGSSSGTILTFEFLDATDLDPVDEAYLTELSFDLSNEALLVRRETYRQNGVDEPSELKLVRD